VLVPEADIARVVDAHRRLLGAIAGLDDQAVGRASLLPGWTVGHVLTHVARNADSHVRRAEAAIRGEVVDQYEGGVDGRAAEIEGGSARPAAEIAEDVRRSAMAVEEAWRALPAGAWTGRTRDAGGMERPLFELPARRWQEVEVHLVDSGAGVTHRDWPDEFVLEWLPRTRERMWGRLPPGTGGQRFDHPADELAWLYGRLRRDDLPELPSWG
jgi:maleylpyruvate isomerase